MSAEHEPTFVDGDLTAALRDLKAAAIGEPDPLLEKRLLRAFDEQASFAPATVRARPRGIWPAAAAAAVVLIAAITWYPVDRQKRASHPQESSPAEAPRTTKPGEPATAEQPTQLAPAPPARPRPARRGPSAMAQPRNLEFVALPGASALPDFESGRIVRVVVPVTTLPAYGLDLVPDARPDSVEAELLVGQDGLARAIRLAAGSNQ